MASSTHRFAMLCSSTKRSTWHSRRRHPLITNTIDPAQSFSSRDSSDTTGTDHTLRGWRRNTDSDMALSSVKPWEKTRVGNGANSCRVFVSGGWAMKLRMSVESGPWFQFSAWIPFLWWFNGTVSHQTSRRNGDRWIWILYIIPNRSSQPGGLLTIQYVRQAQEP